MCGERVIREEEGVVDLQRQWAITTARMLWGGAIFTGVERAQKVYEERQRKLPTKDGGEQPFGDNVRQWG